MPQPKQNISFMSELKLNISNYVGAETNQIGYVETQLINGQGKKQVFKSKLDITDIIRSIQKRSHVSLPKQNTERFLEQN